MTNFEQNQFENENNVSGEKRLKNAFRSVLHYIKTLVSIEKDLDYKATIDNITSSIEFKGVNIWILALAVMVASIGLNMNTAAVIIGAMLISPLMGPINGIGLGIGIMDYELLKKSLKNLGIMVIIGLLASTTYFLLSPLNEAKSELLARTTPTIFDVLIAFLGGTAGIIATSQKKQYITVISGVAIATALMPPLCTAGFGLGTGQLKYFFGAFYLFFINAFFIALATFIIVRYLHFPLKSYIDPIRHKVVKRAITIFSIIVIIPSIFMAIRLVRETSFNTSATNYINKIQKSSIMENSQILNSEREFSGKQSTITLTLIGKELEKNEIAMLKEEMPKYGLKNTELIIRKTKIITKDVTQNDIYENLILSKDAQLARKDSTIKKLKDFILRVNIDSNLSIHLAKELSVQYPSIETISINNAIYINPQTMKSHIIPTALVKWENEPDEITKEQMLTWLKIRLDLDTLKIIE